MSSGTLADLVTSIALEAMQPLEPGSGRLGLGSL
jgi:hypothetical protein